jgi:monovalent cation:H+ antiporter-2, CPA2 family
MNHELTILRELALLAGVSLAINLLFRRVRVPSVIGFLVTGILIGPGMLALVKEPETVSAMAEIGVVLLLFAIGLEFSLADLRKLGRKAAIAGIAQVLGTASVAALALLAMGAAPATAVFFGLLIAPSSTALVFRLLTDRGELQAPHGRLLTGVLLLQDLAVVPMVLLVPALATWAAGGAPGPGGVDATSAFAGGLDVVVRGIATVIGVGAAFMLARRVVPWLIDLAARGRSRETFLSAVALVVLGSAALSQAAGLSLALGAFLAGLVLAESQHRSQVHADILPFRDTLLSVFFISIGMLLSPWTLLVYPAQVLAATVGMVAWKLVAGALAARYAGYPWRVAFAAGLGLAHVGEFSFVLSQAGGAAGLLPSPWDQCFLAGAVFSMMLTPWFVSSAPRWALTVEMKLRGLREVSHLPGSPHEETPQSMLLRDHVIIAGFGLNGRNLARVLRSTGIAHIVVDLDPEAIVECGVEGSPALVGNVTQLEIVKQLGVTRARVLVLALSDPFASRHAARVARQVAPHVFILVRTRSIEEIDALYEAGANLVIPEEFETSIEIFTAVLREYHVPTNVVDAQIMLLRQERYSLLRGRKLPRSVIEQLDAILTQGTTEAVVVLHHSPIVGQVLWETGLLDEEHVKLVAIVRGGKAMIDFDPQMEIRVGDTLVITGGHGALDRVMEKLVPQDRSAT